MSTIDRRKAESLRKSVASLRRSRPGLRGRPCRIDVVAVLWPERAEPRLSHVEDALDGGAWA